MTRSPFFVVVIVKRWLVICSAMRGETLLLNIPVPAPITIKANEKIPSEVCGFWMTLGIAEMMRITWPTKAIAKA